LVEPHQLPVRVNQWYAAISELAPLSIKSMKQIIDHSARQQMDAETAKALSDRCFSSQDFVEGMEAKKQKRTPEFVGQ
jgi:enoyl-CoA hydratase/carnithine racemase